MLNYLRLDNYTIGLPAILVTIAFVLYCQSLVSKRLGAEAIAKCYQVGSTYLQVVGTFYAVLLGLIVVDAMTKFQNAQTSVDNEVASIIAIYSSAERFPIQRQHLEDLTKEYTKQVVNIELPMMDNTGKTDPRARELSLEILKTVKNIEPITENQKTMFSMLLTETSDFLIARRERTKAANFGEPGIEWLILITGGIITVILTFFFTIEANGIHLLMRALVTLTILMSLYLTYLFGSPFAGDLKVSLAPYSMVFDFAKWTSGKSYEESGVEQRIVQSAETTEKTHDSGLQKQVRKLHK